MSLVWRGASAAGSSQLRTVNAIIPPVQEKLNAEESATIRAQLIWEIETLPTDDLQPRAISILKAKNRLSTEDVKLVEESFTARMAPQAALPEAFTTTGEPTSAPTNPAPPPLSPGSTAAAKSLPRRGRPKKVKAIAEQSVTPPMSSKSTNDMNSPSLTLLRADVSLAKIEKKRAHDQRAKTAP